MTYLYTKMRAQCPGTLHLYSLQGNKDFFSFLETDDYLSRWRAPASWAHKRADYPGLQDCPGAESTRLADSCPKIPSLPGALLAGTC